ncbi:hypothetical protein BT96DRAFT_839731, partial [Gymnopus androsaceus JB14]
YHPKPKFDNQFACQNHYEPPPEFPLASLYSGIVHHLLGPQPRTPGLLINDYSHRFLIILQITYSCKYM